MVTLVPFTESDFDRLINWVDSPELLMTIAGPAYTFPLTADQLMKYVDDPQSVAFNVVDTGSNEVIGHAEIITTAGNTRKLDKVLIGETQRRGRGVGTALMSELLRKSFEDREVEVVELNVFDWNAGARKCYEKVGFTINPSKVQVVEFGDKRWITLNMIIDRSKWSEMAS